MKSFISKNVLVHPLVLSSLGVAAVIVLGSGVYYIVATREPADTSALSLTATSTQVVTASGTVEPAQNPDLAFESGGRVARVSVAVGDTVSQGEVLASLDTASLAAGRDQASAALAAQQANLSQMQVGPRQVDVDAKQTGVNQANVALQNLYASAPAQISQAYDKSFSGVSADTDTLFGQPNGVNPVLAFSTSDNQSAVSAINARTMVNNELSTWAGEEVSLSSATPAQIDAALSASLAHLQVLRSYCDTLLVALGNAIASGNFPQASIASAQTSVGALRDSVNTLILSLQSEQQQLAADKLAVQSAQDALNQVLAGSTPQAIEAQQAQVAAAQAQVENANAQLQNAIVVAPFAGSVASVHVKVGDIVPAGTIGVSLNPTSALQIVVYFSEIDITKVKAGAPAQVTLDAYGSSRIFNAEVVSVDTSPSAVGDGTTGYKATLQFLQTDPAISSGMTANVTIPAAQ